MPGGGGTCRAWHGQAPGALAGLGKWQLLLLSRTMRALIDGTVAVQMRGVTGRGDREGGRLPGGRTGCLCAEGGRRRHRLVQTPRPRPHVAPKGEEIRRALLIQGPGRWEGGGPFSPGAGAGPSMSPDEPQPLLSPSSPQEQRVHGQVTRRHSSGPGRVLKSQNAPPSDSPLPLPPSCPPKDSGQTPRLGRDQRFQFLDARAPPSAPARCPGACTVLGP